MTLLTTKQVCELLQIDRTTLHKWRKNGFPFIKTPTGLIRFNEQDIRQWLIDKTKKVV